MTDIHNGLKNIKILFLDVDGVLTDAGIIYNDNGSETKVFNAKDGLGIRLLLDAGIQVGIITGRHSKALRHRCQNLGIVHVFEAVTDKSDALKNILKQTKTTAEQAAFIGDDLPDLKIMKKVGFSIAVANAHEILRENANMVTSAKGGEGAVRETCEAILKAKGLWEKTLEKFL
jgi:3-deoxy-D-manno-octulosonate 8-phosphate phosphatase (KDO 8-P phosphatase)